MKALLPLALPAAAYLGSYLIRFKKTKAFFPSLFPRSYSGVNRHSFV
jgi:hypothetical protein